jgi:hypothetical protein
LTVLADGSRRLVFRQGPLVEGSGETRRVVRSATLVRVDIPASAWADFVDLMLGHDLADEMARLAPVPWAGSAR